MTLRLLLDVSPELAEMSQRDTAEITYDTAEIARASTQPFSHCSVPRRVVLRLSVSSLESRRVRRLVYTLTCVNSEVSLSHSVCGRETADGPPGGKALRSGERRNAQCAKQY